LVDELNSSAEAEKAHIMQKIKTDIAKKRFFFITMTPFI